MTEFRGFTLIELLVTLAIAAVMLGIAAPSFREFFIANSLATQANELVTALNIARSEAIKRGIRVTVCKTGDPAAASPACSTAANWQDGFIVFVDNTQVTGNSRGVVDGSDEVLRVFSALTGSTLSGGANFARGISYLPSGISRGILSGGGDGVADGTFSLCRSGKGRNIMINSTGRVRTEVVDAC